MLDACRHTMIGIRDGALLALQLADGYQVTIRRSKTDQAEGLRSSYPGALKIQPTATVQVCYRPPASLFPVQRGSHVRSRIRTRSPS
jgi:hypothetical protein